MYNIAIIFIGTGKYINYFSNYYDNCEKYFLPNSNKTYFCFTDAEFEGEVPENINVVSVEHESWPYVTLKRFHTILNEKNNLINFDYVIYLDADMLVNEKILEEEILTEKDFIGVYHPGFYKKDQLMPYERRLVSKACIDTDEKTYFQGCLWGGMSKSVIELCEIISRNVDDDLEKEIIAEWHDESHLNKFFIDNLERVYILNPEYAFPEVYDTDPDKMINYPNIDPHNRKIIHLLKNNLDIRS